MPDLSRKRELERLAIRHTPHFQRIGRGASLGLRRRPDTWSARFRARDGKQAHKFLGGPLECHEAKRLAETWLAQLAGSAVRSVKRSTMREALEAYLADLRRHGRPDTAREAEGRFKTVIYDDLIADLGVEYTRSHRSLLTPSAIRSVLMNGAELLVAALENEGVGRIFGVPGEENLDVLDALRRSRVQLILTRHE